jgi:hypothetical protein
MDSRAARLRILNGYFPLNRKGSRNMARKTTPTAQTSNLIALALSIIKFHTCKLYFIR